MMTKETKSRIRELRDSGYSYRQVADGLQIKLETIDQILLSAGAGEGT